MRPSETSSKAAERPCGAGQRIAAPLLSATGLWPGKLAAGEPEEPALLCTEHDGDCSAVMRTPGFRVDENGGIARS